jgi:hypothetical protein
MRWSEQGWILVALAMHFCAGGGSWHLLGRLVAGEQGAASQGAGAGEDLAFQPQDLAGEDRKVGDLAAFKLLQAIASKDPGAQASVQRHLAFLRSALDPARLAQQNGQPQNPAAIVSAQRIVEALTTSTQTSGPAFPELGQVLLPLVGQGPETLRVAIVDSLSALIQWERRASTGERAALPEVSLIDEVGRLVQHNPPPPPRVLADACRILWRNDGKKFLAYTVGGLSLNRVISPGAAAGYVRELRRRLRIGFASPEGWEAWWAENRARTLEEILVDCQRRLGEDYASTWRQSLRRLRETDDVERVLAEIQDALALSYTLEVRLAAVGALADYHDWVRDAKLGRAGGAEVEELRAKLLGRACQLLSDVIQGKAQLMEPPEVTRAAMAALRRYPAFLERSSDLLHPVAELVAERIAGLLEPGLPLGGEARLDLLEAVRTSGALRVAGAQPMIERILREEACAADFELLAASVGALGRLVKRGLSLETARLVLAHFEAAPAVSEAAARELRRACVAALNARPENESVRAEVRAFYAGVLFGGDEKDLRIPAILGLGTLAQEQDGGAIQALVDVVVRSEAFETPEIVAALDAIAYVGGRRALSDFLPLLELKDKLAARDKMIADHLWRKIVALAKLEDLLTLSWLIESITQLAFKNDSLSWLEESRALFNEPDLKEAFAIEKLNPEDAVRLQLLWDLTLGQARVAELLGRDEEAAAILARLSSLLLKGQRLKEAIPAQVELLSSHGAARKQRLALIEKLARSEGLEPAGLLRDFDALMKTETAPWARWCNLRWIERQLGEPALRQAPKLQPLYQLWSTYLASEANAEVLKDLPPAFPERYRRRIEAAGTAPPAPAEDS